MVTPLVTETSYADLVELIKSQRAAVMPVAVIAAAVRQVLEGRVLRQS